MKIKIYISILLILMLALPAKASGHQESGKVDAKETAIGYVPYVKDLDLNGLDIAEDVVEDLLNVDKDLWKEDAAGIREFYQMVGDRVPAELYDELAALEARLDK